MSSNLLNALNKATNIAYTENGAKSNKTTNSAVLDLFSQISAYRTGAGASARIQALRRAYGEDALLTLKCLFYSRDIRGGQGERETFRVFMKELVKINISTVMKNLHLIPEYGRWDDVFELVGLDKNLDARIVSLVAEQIHKDLSSERPSLLGKWMPSINTSSSETKKLAKWLCNQLGWREKQYRKNLSLLRSRIKVLEAIISRNKWDSVVYEGVPSNASLKYRKAFKKHDTERYAAYIASVQKGEKKINAATLFPYDIVKKSLSGEGVNVLDALWNNLPNFYGEHTENALVVVDVSGSMYGCYGSEKNSVLPIYVSISLGLYLAERNKSIWHNRFITFTTNPKLQKIQGVNIHDKIKNLAAAEWGGSTNVEAVFRLILNTAVANNLTQADMPARLYIISDMEFNAATGSSRNTLFRGIQKEYESKGYQMPQLVFWNVSARNEQFPMSMDDRGFVNVSGCSPSIVKNLLGRTNTTAYDLMVETLNSDRYKAVEL